MKIYFIVNPNAGPSRFQSQLLRAQEHLQKLGCQVSSFETQARGHATQLAQQAVQEKADIAVAVGGDGTINEVCNGLVDSETALGVLPAGTANVYAAEVGIPIWGTLTPDAIIRGADIIATGQRRAIDLGKLHLADGTSRYFLMWCGIGLDAAITQSKQSVATARSLNYITWFISGLMIAYDFLGTPAKIVTDQDATRRRVIMIVVSNSQLYGRIWRLAPEAKLDDGLLDVGVLSGRRWPSTFRHVIGLTFRRHIKDPDFKLYRTANLSVSAKRDLPVHVDAETIGTTPIKIEVAHRALNVIIPHSAPARLFEEN